VILCADPDGDRRPPCGQCPRSTTQDVPDREPAHLCPACDPLGPSDADRGGAGQGLSSWLRCPSPALWGVAGGVAWIPTRVSCASGAAIG